MPTPLQPGVTYLQPCVQLCALYGAPPTYFLVDYVGNLFIHGWGAIKNLFCLGPSPYLAFLLTKCLHCPPTAEELLKTCLLGAHATHTACLPHFNLSCQSLLAKQFIHGCVAIINPSMLPI